MFEDRGPSIFPHAASAWWIPIFLAVGLGSLFSVDILHLDGSGEDGWTFAIGNLVALPCTAGALLSLLVQVFRLLMYFVNRLKPISK
jgi:hypothetical protein